MRRLYLLLILFMCCQAVFASPGKGIVIGDVRFNNALYARDPDPEPSADFKTMIVPIKRAGNLIIVEAQVDTLEGNFVLDTGAPYLILNATYFRQLPKIDDQEAGGINGTSPGSFTTYVHNFNILDLQYSRLTAGVVDLSFIENGRNLKVLGLLGTRLFSKFAITVDLTKNVLYIHKLDNKGNIPEGEQIFHNKLLSTPFSLMNDVVFIKATVNTKTFWFAFDSAAETNLFDYDRSKKLPGAFKVISRSKVSGLGGSKLEVLYAQFDELRVGGHVFRENKVLLTNLDKMGESYGHSVDGILGYDFFARGIFSINFVKKEFDMYNL